MNQSHQNNNQSSNMKNGDLGGGGYLYSSPPSHYNLTQPPEDDPRRSYNQIRSQSNNNNNQKNEEMDEYINQTSSAFESLTTSLHFLSRSLQEANSMLQHQGSFYILQPSLIKSYHSLLIK